MERICPVCNGMMPVYYHCRLCGRLLEDRGRPEDYAAPYSPYISREILSGERQKSGVRSCPHLMSCRCGFRRVIAFNLWVV